MNYPIEHYPGVCCTLLLDLMHTVLWLDFFLATNSSSQTLCSQRQMQLRRLNICLVIYFSVLVGWRSLHWQQAHIPCGWDAGFSLLFHSRFFSRFCIFAPVPTSAEPHGEGRNSVTHLLFGIVQKPSHTLPPLHHGWQEGRKKEIIAGKWDY